MSEIAPISGSSLPFEWELVLAVSDIISTSSLRGLARLAYWFLVDSAWEGLADISFLLLVTAKLVAPPEIILAKPCDWVVIFIILVGFTISEEQHIIQNTTARNRYPVLLELDLDLISLSESILSSLLLWNELKFWFSGSLIEVLERWSLSSNRFFLNG